ncbi:ABC transporter ATP-binding protein [Parvicella tangerina]|uniref:ABC transporter ATP-binding protein n=1 Tax=Parvicella tangerina TaxID=2829795 RepID=A0A916NAW5_9FLAO|nr:ABC transporter ATP-binding protein [Parvicella tangerina]CAG5079975.1 putative ABC transporter ATP-binding protein [Parvicella tangerina]
MSKEQGRTWDTSLFKRVFSFTKPYGGLLAIILTIITVLAILGPLRIALIDHMVHHFIEAKDLAGLRTFALIIVGILLGETFLNFATTYLSQKLGQSIVKDLRNQLFSHITKLRLKFFDKNPIGMLVTRAVSDMETVAQIFSQGFLSIIGDILVLVFALTMMFVINWQLAFIVLIPIPLLIIATNIFKKAIKKSFQDVRKEVSALNTFVQERITGMALVKVFGRSKREAKTFSEINNRHKKANIRSIWAYSIFFPVVEILSGLSLGLLILYTLSRVDDPGVNFGELAGQLTAFIMFINMIYRPIRMLADKFNTLQMGLVGAERVFKILDTDELIPNTGKVIKHDFKGGLSFKNVWFAYNNEDYVLKNLNFEVEAGETVAFVGATGAGKTSIINLLGRFYEFQKGSIEIDGEDIRDIELNLLRDNISVVLQDVFLYSGSIYDNVTLGNPEISKEQVVEAAKLVGAHEFIDRLPDGYDFNVKERGGLLSVGQRQLIAFIRAYVYQPKILILDEATSSIDSESEMLIQNAIDKLTKGRTSIVIAHRLSTIKNANKIIVLEKGEIIEMGSHAELLQQEDGAYRKLYETQFDGHEV